MTMGDWDWGSSDIGGGSSGGFSGDDYYWTGGKFTDWSGNSAGKFDWNTGGSSGSPSGGASSGGYNDGCGYDYVKRYQEVLTEEKKHGLPETFVELPTVVGSVGIVLRVLMVCFLLLMQGLCGVMYLHYPEWKLYFGHGTGFICAYLYLLWFIVTNGNLFYNFRVIIAWKMHLFRTLWLFFCCTSLFISSAIALTPILCHYLRYWLVQHHEFFIFTFFDEFTRLSSWDYDLDLYWWVMVISAFIAWIPLVFALGIIYLFPNEVKITRKMVPYMLYRQNSKVNYSYYTRTPKNSDIGCALNVILLIGILSTGVMVIASIQNYNDQKFYYNMRIESERRLDEMLHRFDQPDEDTMAPDTVPHVDMVEPAKPTRQANPAVSKSSSKTSKTSRHHSSRYSSGYSSSLNSSSYDDDDDDDTWYRDEDDADERDEYDYWE